LAVLTFLLTAKIASAWRLSWGKSWFDSNACTINFNSDRGFVVPLYDFYCKKCDANFELQKSMNDENKDAICEKCNSQMNRVYFPAPAIFKGSGWGGQ
jgi:putative FmdB family regulatory protein